MKRLLLLLGMSIATSSAMLPPLHQAASEGDAKRVRELLASGADRMQLDNERNWTAAHYAARSGHGDVIDALIEGLAPDRQLGLLSLTPPPLGSDLPIAIEECDQVRSETFVQVAGVHGRTSLIKLPRDPEERSTVMEKLLEKSDWEHPPVLVSIATSSYGPNALDLAVEYGHERVVRKLLAHGVKRCRRTGRSGETPLHRAAKKGHSRIVEVLLERLSPAEQLQLILQDDINGSNSLFVAILSGYNDIVQSFIDRGAQRDARTRFNMTPLHVAAGKGHFDIVNTILDRVDADEQFRLLSLTDNCGMTPLHYATQRGHTNIVCRFLELGANSVL